MSRVRKTDSRSMDVPGQDADAVTSEARGKEVTRNFAKQVEEIRTRVLIRTLSELEKAKQTFHADPEATISRDAFSS